MAIDDLRQALEAADPDSLHPARWVLEKLGERTPLQIAEPTEGDPLPWNALLWRVPPETRLNVEQAAEALGKSVSWIYENSNPRKVEDRTRLLPHRKEGGRLRFVASDLRAWVQANETRP